MNIYRNIKCIGFLLLSNLVLAEGAYTDNELGIPHLLLMGVKHQSYDFASIEKSGAKLAMDSTLLKIPLGKFDVGSRFFIPTVSVQKTGFRFDDVDRDNQDVYTLKTQLMFVNATDGKWTSIIQVTPSIHSDLEAVDEDAFSLMGVAIWRYKSTDMSSWVMGVGFNRLFGEYKPIPLVSYQYKVANNFQLDFGFPITKAEYRWNTNWSTYLSALPVGGNWRYEAAEGEKLNISYSSWITTAGIRYQLKPKVWATLEVGKSLSRQLNLDTDNNIEADLDVASAPVVMFSIGLRR